MNEAEFIARRIIRTGAAWAEKEYEEGKKKDNSQLLNAQKYSSRIQLLNHIADQFLTEENNASN
jgi:hypothetical protein